MIRVVSSIMLLFPLLNSLLIQSVQHTVMYSTIECVYFVQLWGKRRKNEKYFTLLFCVVGAAAACGCANYITRCAYGLCHCHRRIVMILFLFLCRFGFLFHFMLLNEYMQLSTCAWVLSCVFGCCMASGL